MGADSLTRLIRADIWPFLAEQGFSSFTGRSAWRRIRNRIEVVNFQSANPIEPRDGQSFLLNLGVHFNCIPDAGRSLRLRDGHFAPEEWMCHLRRHVAPPDNACDEQPLWHVGDQLPKTTVIEALGGVALPWFHQYSDVRVACDLVGGGDPFDDGCGNNPSPQRSFVTGFLALAAGQDERAVAHLHAVKESGCFPLDVADIERAIAEAAANIRRRRRR